MVVFFYKIKLWGKIRTVILLLLLFFITETVVKSSGDPNQKGLISSTGKKRKNKKKSLTGYQLHYNKQTKKVQKRMTKDNKKTEKFYNQKLGYTFFQRLFGKNKKR
jgi:hypothetical protein